MIGPGFYSMLNTLKTAFTSPLVEVPHNMIVMGHAVQMPSLIRPNPPQSVTIPVHDV
jgi:hypothetical protein